MDHGIRSMGGNYTILINQQKETNNMSDTIEIQGKTYIVMTQDELDQMLFDANEKGYVSGRIAIED